MIRDIMVANPQSAKNEELLDAIDQRNDPMPDSMWVEILQGMDTVGALERLISELDGGFQRRDIYFNALSELFLVDTINEWAPDSLINLLQSDEQLSSHYVLAQYYLNHFNLSEAGNELQNISSQFDLNDRQSATHQKILSVVSILPVLYNDTTGYLIPDSIQQLTLQALSSNKSDIAGAYARNILIASGLQDYQEPILATSTLKSLKRYHGVNIDKAPVPYQCKVFPNPCKDYITIEYLPDSETSGITVDIIDFWNRTISKYRFLAQRKILVVPMKEYPSGIYFLRIDKQGFLVEIHRVIHLN